MIENSLGFGLIAVEKTAGRVVFLDPETLALRKAIDGLPPKPHELLITSLGRKAYVPIFGDGIHGDNPHPQHHVAVIDLDRQAVAKLIDISPYRAPHTARLGANGLIYCCCEASAAVVVIDPARDEMVGAIPVGSYNVHRLATIPAEHRLVTETEEDGVLSLVDLEGTAGRVVEQRQVQGGTNGIAASPVQPWIVATAAAAPELLVLDRGDLRPLRTLPLPGHARKGQIARFRPDGAVLAVIGDFDPVASFYDADLNYLFTAEVQDKPLDGSFSPDGLKFLVCNERSGTVSVIDLVARRTVAHVAVDSGFEVLGYYPLKP